MARAYPDPAFQRDDTPERQLDKLEAMLALTTEDVRGSAPGRKHG